MKRALSLGLTFAVLLLQTSNLALPLNFAHASTLTFGTTLNLSNDSETSDFPRIASAGINVYATWQNSTATTNPNIVFTASLNNGTSFGPLYSLSNDPQSFSTDQQIVAIGSNIYVSWVGNATGNDDIYFRASNDNGTNFGNIVNLSNDTGSSSNPRVAATGSSVFVAWQSEVTGPPGSTDIFFAVSNDAGGSFGSTENLSNDGVSSSPEVATALSNVYATWQDYNGGLNDLFLRGSTSNGAQGTFGPVVNLSNNPVNPVTLAVSQRIVAIANDVYVAWTIDTSTSDDIAFTGSLNNATSFGNVIPLTSNGASTNPRLAAAGAYVHLVWEDHSVPGVSMVYYARSGDEGATFGPASAMSSSTGFSANPQAAVETTNVYIAWEDSTVGDTFLRSSDDNGASFGNQVNLSGNSGFSVFVGLATGRNRVYSAWQDDTPGNDDIVFRTGAVRVPFQQHNPILISDNAGFTSANGVVSGSGTAQDPYIIEGWQIDASSADGITLENTNAYFVIRDVKVQSVTQGFTGLIFDTVSNGRLENSTILSNFSGIHFTSSTDITIDSNTITDNGFSVSLYSSNNIRFVNNKIANSFEGITIYYSTNISLQANNFTSSGLFIQGSSITQYDSHTITQDNTVNGRPLYYYKDCADQALRDMAIGQLIVANCSRFDATNLSVADSAVGVEMAYVDTAVVTGNTVFSNILYGIYVTASSNLTITRNKVESNLGSGIQFESTQRVRVSSNSISSNGQYGLFLSSSQSILVFHNNITSNGVQAFDGLGTENSWDNGYPSGGNYWSGYTGVDDCNGPMQNACTGPDGIGDTPYTIDSDSIDHYPLMQPSVPDTSSPSWPVGSSLVGSNISPTSMTLTWSAATDDVGVVQYRVYQGITLVATVAANVRSYNVTGLTPDTSYTFKVEAGDASDNWSTDGPSAMVRTTTGNAAPVLDPISAKTVDEEAPLTFTATATDPDGDSLVWSLGTAPATASITSGGVFSWTPSEAEGPGTYTVTVIVSDGSLSDSKTFNVTVREVNKPPILSVTGFQSVKVGDILTFKVNATDSDLPGNIVTLSATGLPNGASFNSTTGVFTFTPNSGQAGSSFIITFKATDDGTPSLSDTKTVDVAVSARQQGLVWPDWATWLVVGVASFSAVSLGVWVRSRRRSRRVGG